MCMEDLGIKLMPAEEVRFFERVFVQLENTKGFLKRY